MGVLLRSHFYLEEDMTKAEKQAKIDTIINRYRNGSSFDEIGKEVGYCPDYVRQLLTKMGEHEPRKKKELGHDEEIIKRYLNGESNISLAKSFDVSPQIIQCKLKQLGISGKRLDKRNESMRNYKAQGHTMQETADKFGVSKAVAQQICKGIAPQKADTSNYNPPPNKGKFKPEKEVAEAIENSHPNFKYLGGYKGCESHVYLQCKECGEITTRSMNTLRHKNVVCRKCEAEQKRLKKIKAEEEKEQKKKAQEIIRKKAQEEREKKRRQNIEDKKHNCPVCGKETIRPIYCSDSCAKKAKNKVKDLKKRKKITAVLIDNDITVRGLFNRDAGMCYLCGEPCNYDDFYINEDGVFIAGDMYPSIDHVIPLAKGGRHSWGNIRLAHRRCNYEKADKIV